MATNSGVLIADDNELLRLGLKTALLEAFPTLNIWEASSKEAVFEVCQEHEPGVMIIDYSEEDFGISFIPKMRERFPRVQVIALTYLMAGNTIVRALKSGVASYVKKDCSLDEIVEAVEKTGKGERFFCGTILDTIRAESIDVEDIGFDPLGCAPLSLSERELEIIALIAQGFTNPQIAEKLILSSHTITTHRKNIMNKLGVNNTAGIVMYAVKSQLISPNRFLFSVDN